MVYWSSPVILSTSCRIDARKFPFDAQLCTLRFVPWGEDVNDVDLILRYRSIPRDDKFFIENGVWKLDGVSVKRELVKDYGTYA